MRTIEIGTKVRLTPRVWGTVVRLDETMAVIRWVKVKGVTERKYQQRFVRDTIIPDATPLSPEIKWRLQFWIQDGSGKQLDTILSVANNDPPKWWQPYTPLPK